MAVEGILVQGRRYLIDGLVGAGAFGEVYRARREDDGLAVAVKRLRAHIEPSPARDRMLREARLLSRIESPHVVRHLEHGPDAEGQFCLVLEWLEGEDLARRQRVAPLTLAESVEAARQFALGLDPIHRAGVVHRDVKPSNLFLVAGAGQALRVKVIDLGVASVSEETALTADGHMIGTTAYMSPEQVRGDPLTPHADLFSLGVVLYELITGELPFAADEPFAVLAKILLAEPRRLRDVARVPAELDDLVMRSLSKGIAARPATAAEVAATLAQVAASLAGGGAAGQPPASGSAATPETLTPALSPGDTADSLEVTDDGPTEVLSSSAMRRRIEPADLVDAGMPGAFERRVVTAIFARWADGAEPELSMDRFGEIVAALGGSSVRAASRRMIALFGMERTLGDEAARAARAALEAAEIPGLGLAIATGRAVTGDEGLSHDAIEWGATELDRSHGEIRIDAATARLLPGHFALESIAGATCLRGETGSIAPAAPRFFGRSTPMVGRDRELGTLEAIARECASEGVARAVLVTGVAGAGKSRLRFEFLRRLRESSSEAQVLFGRGDSLRAGSPFGLLADAIRGAAGILDGEPLEVRQDKLAGRIGRRLAPSDRDRVASFLGEIVGAPFPDDPSGALRAARADKRLLGDAIRAAWEDWLDAECAVGPVVLVLEDLHWGDRATVALVDGALRNLHDRPLMVLALARPEVSADFPGLWSARPVEQIAIDGLTPKASQRLVREVLGDDVSEATVALIVDRADGNPFYLEELMRAVATGVHEGLPDTVLGMLQARLDALGADARRVLRLASVFGERFWLGGAVALAGGKSSGPAAQVRIRAWLVELCDREVIARRATAKFPDEVEYVYRHALVREAAYAMLADDDRRLAHHIAGSWLVDKGETDAIVLAEHFERGGASTEAVAWFLRGAEQALVGQGIGDAAHDGGDLEEALARAKRGIASGASGATLGALLLVQAEAHFWRGELSETERCAARCAAELPRGTPGWLRAVRQVIAVMARQARYGDVETWVDHALAPPAGRPGTGTAEDRPLEETSGLLLCLCHGAEALLMNGRATAADRLIERVAVLETALGRLEPATHAQVHRLRALRSIHAQDFGAAVSGLSDALSAFERAGDARNACTARLNIGYVLAQLGSFAEAESALRQALSTAERMGLRHVAGFANHNLGYVLARSGRLEEGRAIEVSAVAAGKQQGDPRLEAVSRVYLAWIEKLCGDLGAAEREALAAQALMPETPSICIGALAALAAARLAGGRHDEALAAARAAIRLLAGDGVEEGESPAQVVLVEALLGRSLRDEAREAAAAARARLLDRADKIADPTWREGFLTRVPEHARLLELARELVGDRDA